jgi:DNA polymerase-3 subunit alpha
VLEALIHSGACDAMLQPLGVGRASACASIEIAIERARAASKDREAGQSNMFGLFAAASAKTGGAPAAASGDKYVEAPPWDFRELLANEKKSLGFYLSGHPLDRYGSLSVQTTEAMGDVEERTKVRLAGVVEGYRERPMKTGGKMAFFELEDRTGRIEVKVRPQGVEQFAHVLSAGEPVVLKGMLVYDRRNADEAEEDSAVEPTPQIMLDDAVLLADHLRTETRAVGIRLGYERARREQLQRLAEHLSSCRGNCPVTLTLTLDDGAEVHLALGSNFRVEASDKMLSGLERLFGQNVAELRAG